jgi:hypothetical protein
MKVTLHSTSKIVELVVDGNKRIPARIWEGETAGGVKCHAYIVRIAAADNQDLSEFERELQAHKPPTAEVNGIPLRLII